MRINAEKMCTIKEVASKLWDKGGVVNTLSNKKCLVRRTVINQTKLLYRSNRVYFERNDLAMHVGHVIKLAVMFAMSVHPLATHLSVVQAVQKTFLVTLFLFLIKSDFSLEGMAQCKSYSKRLLSRSV